jgi:hypothetical protein
VAEKATGYLIKPRCKVDGTTPERRKTKHLYIRLDALRDQIVEWFKVASKKGGWSTNAIGITEAWIEKGLKPRGITRDLKWGVPIPKGLKGLHDEDYANKVFYGQSTISIPQGQQKWLTGCSLVRRLHWIHFHHQELYRQGARRQELGEVVEEPK